MAKYQHEVISHCPYCGKPVWGEGWNPQTQERYYSHVKLKHYKKCGAHEIAVIARKCG